MKNVYAVIQLKQCSDFDHILRLRTLLGVEIKWNGSAIASAFQNALVELLSAVDKITAVQTLPFSSTLGVTHPERDQKKGTTYSDSRIAQKAIGQPPLTTQDSSGSKVATSAPLPCNRPPSSPVSMVTPLPVQPLTNAPLHNELRELQIQHPRGFPWSSWLSPLPTVSSLPRKHGSCLPRKYDYPPDAANRPHFLSKHHQCQKNSDC